MKKTFTILLAIMMFALACMSPVYADDHTDCITDHLVFFEGDNERYAIAFFAFIFNQDFSDIESAESLRAAVAERYGEGDANYVIPIYDYMTGRLNAGTQEYIDAQLLFHWFVCTKVNESLLEYNERMEISRVSLISYLEKKVGGNIAQEMVDETLGDIKDNLRNITITLGGEEVENAFNEFDVVRDLAGIGNAKKKAAEYVERMTAVLNGVRFYTGRNMAKCYEYFALPVKY